MPAAEKPRRSDFALVPDRVVAHVEASYGVRVRACPPILLDGPEAGLVHLRSETCKKAVLETDAGTLFLKEVPWYCDDERLLSYRLRFERALGAAGVPVAGVLRTVAGASWLELDGSRFVVSRHVRGVRYQGSAAEARAAGAVLAHMHHVTVDPQGAPGESAFSLARQFIALARSTAAGDAPRARAAERAGPVVDQAERAAEDAGFSELPACGVHGDFSPWNLLFSGGEVAAVLDFDNCDHASAVHDLAEALVTYAVMRYRGPSTSLAGVEPEPDSAAVRALVRGYAAVRPLARGERDVLAAVCTATLVELLMLGLLRGDLSPAGVAGLRPAAVGADLAASALAAMQD